MTKTISGREWTSGERYTGAVEAVCPHILGNNKLITNECLQIGAMAIRYVWRSDTHESLKAKL